MSFLYFDEHTRKITVSPEAEDIPEIKILRDKDVTEEKKFYNDALSYVFHVYKKEHFFSHLPINERKNKTCEKYMSSRDYHKFEDNSKVRDLIKFYVSLEYSQNEWTYQGIKNNIKEVKDSINDIPLTKIIKINQKVDVDVPCGTKGKMVVRTVEVKQDVVVDNTKERMDAFKRILELEEMEEKFREIIQREKKVKEHNSGRSLLEDDWFEDKTL